MEKDGKTAGKYHSAACRALRRGVPRVFGGQYAVPAVLEDRLIYMQLRLDAPITDEYIRRIAREKLNYRDPDEILFYNDLAD